MRRTSVPAPVILALFVAIVVGGSIRAQTGKPSPTRQQPQSQQPTPPTPAPDAAIPAPPPAQPAPAPPQPVLQDLRFEATYTTEGLKTQTVTYIKGQRQRYELQDMVILKQPDQKRTIQISRSANTYLIAPDGAPPAVPAVPAADAATAKPSGLVRVTTMVVDTGERKTMFGRQARRVKTTIERQPQPGACDSTKQRIETDGWYVDLAVIAPLQTPEQPGTPAGDCADRIEATANGDPKALGFPIAYITTATGDDGKPVVASMEVSELELTTLDAALFEIPPGLHAAQDLRQMAKALSDANEATLAAADGAPAAAVTPKAPGVIRIGVPEFANKTPQVVDTRALRQRLMTGLSDTKDARIEAVPMAAAAQGELQKRATELGYDYVVLAEVTELKASKPGRFGGLMRAASGVAGGRGGMTGAAAGAAGAASAPQDTTESTIAVKLIQPDGRERLSTTARGKDGSGFSLQTGLGLARFAGGMYLSMFAGPQMFARLYGFGTGNLGGMGLLGNPMLHQMQMGGLGGVGRGVGIDQTAGAASFVMQQAMAMNDLGGLVGVPGQGPSYDESIGEAVQNAAKAVQKALQGK